MDDAARCGDGRKARNGGAEKLAGFADVPGVVHGDAGSCGLRGAAVGMAFLGSEPDKESPQASATNETALRSWRKPHGGKPGAPAVAGGQIVAGRIAAGGAWSFRNPARSAGGVAMERPREREIAARDFLRDSKH